jgi:hypothetical protein
MDNEIKTDDSVDETPVVETPVVESTEKEVSIPTSVLDRLMTQIDSQAKDISLLRQAVNQNKLLDAENAAKPADLPKAYLKVFLGKIVVGWKMAKTEMLYHPTNPNMPVGEILKSVYYFIDGTESEPVDQVAFTRCDDKVIVRIVDGPSAVKNSEVGEVSISFESLVTTDEDLKRDFVLPSGTYKIHKNFLNA